MSTVHSISAMARTLATAWSQRHHGQASPLWVRACLQIAMHFDATPPGPSDWTAHLDAARGESRTEQFAVPPARDRSPRFSARPGFTGRVMVLLDNILVAETIRLTLNHGRYSMRQARSVGEAREILVDWEPHVAVLDMDVGGPQILTELGGAGGAVAPRIPVVGLTRRGDLPTRLAAFDRGVDDVLTLPFSPEELLARMLVVFRRKYGEPTPIFPTIQLGELEIDIMNRRVRTGMTELHLTPVELRLLYLLAASAGNIVTRSQIMDAVWGVDFLAESNVVDRHVRSLRIKLRDDWRQPRFIATVAGRGYRFLPTSAGSPPQRG